MEQTGDDWHSFRRGGIGSSDAPIIMGVSPWSTLHKLWEVKTGRFVEEEKGFILEKGNQMEPIARAQYELQYGVDMPPRVIQNPSVEWLRASLDGYSEDGRVVLEIKMAGAKDHEGVLEGRVPDKYYPQVQHQLMVTGAQRVDYCSLYDSKIAVVQVLPDDKYIEQLLKAEYEFWQLVQSDTPPPLVERDYKLIRGQPEIRAMFERPFMHEELAEKFKGKRVRCSKWFYCDHKGVREGL